MRRSLRVAVCVLVLTVAFGISQLGAHDPSQFTFTIIAGTASDYGSADGPGLGGARFRGPEGLAAGSGGRFIVADTGNHMIRAISGSQVVTTLGGAAGVAGSADGASSVARFNGPAGVALHADGTVYVADTGNHTIRRISAAGDVSTLAGSAGSSGSTDGTGTAARFLSPSAVAVAADHTVYVADMGNNRIRRIASTGEVSTLPTTFTEVNALAMLPDGGLAVGAGGSVRIVTTTGVVSTRASTAVIFGLGVDAAGMIYVGTSTGIHSVSPEGVVTEIPDTYWTFQPIIQEVTVGSDGAIYYVASDDFGFRSGHQVRRLLPTGGASEPWAGQLISRAELDGQGALARFDTPAGLTRDAAGNLYVADSQGNRIRKISPSGAVTTLAPGVQWYLPESVAVDANGYVFVADTYRHMIRRLAPDGTVIDWAGITGGGNGYVDGPGPTARFRNPGGLAIGADGALYVADRFNCVIRRVGTDQNVTTLAGGQQPYGSAGQCANVDGTGPAARFGAVETLSVGPSGDLFVADKSNHTIRRVTMAGVVTTIAGTAGQPGHTDGARAVARFRDPTGVAAASDGAVYVTDSGSNTVRQIAPDGTVTTIGGVALQFGSAEGTGSAARFWNPRSIIVDPQFTLYITDSNNNTIVKGTPVGPSTPPASATASPTALRFGIQRGSPHRATAQQRVVASYTGSTAPIWTATVNASWLSVDGSTTNGVQTGAFLIDVDRTAINFDTAPDTMTATLTIAASNVSVTIEVPVTLRLTAAGPLRVIGQVDTPVQNATGVQGAIGVTGWAIHPIGIRWVRVYRDCLVGEEPCTPGQEPGLGDRRVVFIGHAVFVPGARPDIEAAFPEYPASHIGGWGMQILTNQLPRTTGTFAGSGGQGPITLHMLATPITVSFDSPGDATLLSRAWTDTVYTPTTITLDNDAIAKPFGTIDTPASAATVSGTFANFGWAITPDSDTVADGTDILIPTSGSSMVLFIDGVATAQIAYNQCRGTVGNPVPAGVYCNDDIASIFGNPTPQEALGTRTSNPTRFRNLDAGRGAIGAYNIDTTRLTNGLHTMAWSVTDSAGRVEGIGNRYFTVLNGSSGAVRAQRAEVAANRRDFGVVGRTGFDLRRPWTPLRADDHGIRHVRIPIDNGRVELSLGAGIEAGYLEANGERRPLPPGSAFDVSTGIFTWAPGPGFIGTYRFAFVGPEVQGSWGPGVQGSKGPEVRVDVTLRAETPVAPGESEIRMHLDTARLRPASVRLRRGYGAATTLIDVVGWALDPQAEIGAGIGAVHVWAIPRSNASAVFLGEATLDIARPDVAAAHGAPFRHAGFRLETTTALPPGEYDITAYVWNWRTARWEDARSARVTVR